MIFIMVLCSPKRLWPLGRSSGRARRRGGRGGEEDGPQGFGGCLAWYIHGMEARVSWDKGLANPPRTRAI